MENTTCVYLSFEMGTICPMNTPAVSFLEKHENNNLHRMSSNDFFYFEIDDELKINKCKKIKRKQNNYNKAKLANYIK